MRPSGPPATDPPRRPQALGGVATRNEREARNTLVGICEDRMDTALNPAAAHRSDARLHVLGPSSTASPQTVRV